MKVVSLHWSLGQSKGIKFALTYWLVSTFGRHPDKKNYGQPLPLSLLVGLHSIIFYICFLKITSLSPVNFKAAESLYDH